MKELTNINEVAHVEPSTDEEVTDLHCRLGEGESSSRLFSLFALLSLPQLPSLSSCSSSTSLSPSLARLSSLYSLYSSTPLSRSHSSPSHPSPPPRLSLSPSLPQLSLFSSTLPPLLPLSYHHHHHHLNSRIVKYMCRYTYTYYF